MRYFLTGKIGLRASYSSGYRAPQAYNENLHIDAMDNKVAIIRLALDLKPEYSNSLNASANLYHNFGCVQANLLVEGFYTMFEDVFTLEKIGEDTQATSLRSAATLRVPLWPVWELKPRRAFRDGSNCSWVIPPSAAVTTNSKSGRTT